MVQAAEDRPRDHLPVDQASARHWMPALRDGGQILTPYNRRDRRRRVEMPTSRL